MQNLMQRQKVSEFVRAALECSVYIAPRDPGLAYDELLEIGKRLGYQEGEIGDALPGATAPAYFGNRRLQPARNPLWLEFHIGMDPEYRNVAAFDFVGSELGALVRSLGVRKARIERSALIARALAKGLPERDVEAAITIMILGEHLAEEAGVVWFAPGRETWPLASSQAREGRDSIHSEIRATAYAIVKDVIERRGDGRPTSVEPLDAFVDVLERLGYEPFRLWWKQLLSELRRSDTVLSPVTVSVLAAALVEGALTFVVEHARRLGLGVFGSKDCTYRRT